MQHDDAEAMELSDTPDMWIVNWPFYNADSEDVFNATFKAGPCPEMELQHFLFALLADERLLLKTLRAYGCEDFEDIDEKAKKPLTKAGYFAGSPESLSLSNLATWPALDVKSGAIA